MTKFSMFILEAAVIAAIIAAIGVVVKAIFDWLNVRMQNTFNLMTQELASRERISEKMIDKVHKYAELYYFPLLKRADEFAYYLKRMKEEEDDDNDDEKLKKYSFFRLVMFLKAINKLFDEVGCVLLKSLDLEEKIVYLIDFFENNINIDLRDTSYLINYENIKSDSFISKLGESIENENMLLEIYEKYKGNISNEETRDILIESLKALNKFFLYGINTIFEPWYGEKPESIDEAEKILAEIKKQLQQDSTLDFSDTVLR